MTFIEEPPIRIRDQFAMAALIGMLVSAPLCDRTKIDKLRWAEAAYDWADAMRVIRQGNRPRRPRTKKEETEA